MRNMTQTETRQLETSENFKLAESTLVGSHSPNGKQPMNTAIREITPTPGFLGKPETERSLCGKGKRLQKLAPWCQMNNRSDITTNHRIIPSRNYRCYSDVTRPKLSGINASGNSAVDFGKSTPLLGRKSQEHSQDCVATVISESNSVDNNLGRTGEFDSDHSEASYDQHWPQFPEEWIESRSVEMMDPVAHSQQAVIMKQNPTTYTQSLDEVRRNCYSTGNLPMYMTEYSSVEPSYNLQNEGNTQAHYYDPQGLVPFALNMPPECYSNTYETNVYPQELANVTEDSFSSMCESSQYSMPSSMLFPAPMMYHDITAAESQGIFNGAGPSIPFTIQSCYPDGSPNSFQGMYTCANNPADIFYPPYLTSETTTEYSSPNKDEIGNICYGDQIVSRDSQCPNMSSQTPMTQEPLSSFIPFQEVEKIPMIEEQSAVVHLQPAEEQTLINSISDKNFCMETVSEPICDRDKVLTGFTDAIFETITVSDTSESCVDFVKQCPKSHRIEDGALIVQSRYVRKENTLNGKFNEDTPTGPNANNTVTRDANAFDKFSTDPDVINPKLDQDDIVDTKLAQLSLDQDDRIETTAKDVFCRSERNTEDDISDNFITMETFSKGNTSLSDKRSSESSCGEKYFTASEKSFDTSMTIAVEPTERSSDLTYKLCTLSGNSSTGSLYARSTGHGFSLGKKESSDLSFKSISDRDGKCSECEF